MAIAASLALTALATGLGQNDAAQSLGVTLAKDSTTVSATAPLATGLTKITATNTGSKPTNFLVARITPGATLEQLVAAVNASPAIPEDLIDNITSFFGLAPGATFTTTVNLPPGEYISTQPPDGKGTGPFTTFTVGSTAAGGTPPATVGKVELYDYGIKAPRAIKGKGTLRLDNIGLNYHFLVALKVKNPKDAAKVVAGILSGRQPRTGPPTSIIGIVGPGTTNYVDISLKKGEYVIACFNSDHHSAGHNHAQFGMVRALRVK
ncbi:MAG TPA: hypothetical protein VL422_12505 [Miltoncostaea sp.]|nr:hypothetical protein [Miltoncostaea sp.]